MSDHENKEAELLRFTTGDCAQCGRPTQVPLMTPVYEGEDDPEPIDEPFICNRCLRQIRRDMTTEFQVRQLVESLNTKLWVMALVFAPALTALSFLAGLYFGCS